jgi:tRNA(His) 5'-end guanylyltransferase
MCSIAASLATYKFNKLRSDNYRINCNKPAIFDARVFVIPDNNEVLNYLIWRQQDATKNSISMAAQAYYSPKELHKKNGSEKQEMLFEKGINWNDYSIAFKRGTAVYKVVKIFAVKIDKNNKPIGKPQLLPRKDSYELEINEMTIQRKTWEPDIITSIFTQNRDGILSIIS